MNSDLNMTAKNQPEKQSDPTGSGEEPFYGCMQGLAIIHCDLTKPVDIEWKALK
jgi:hypothetical protein